MTVVNPRSDQSSTGGFDDLNLLTYDMTGFKPFTILRSFGRQSERLANNYISYASNVRRIRRQLWFNHRCKDLGLVPAGLRWTQNRPFRSSKPPVDDWSESGLTTVTEDWTTTTTNYNNDLKNLNISYRLTYLTLYWLLPTNELTKPKNNTATKLNRNLRDYNVLRTKNDIRQTTTGSGIFLPVL